MSKVKLVDGSKQKPFQDAMDSYYKPREGLDYDMLTLIGMWFDSIKRPDLKKYMMSSPDIIAVAPLSSDIQRVIINKYLKFLLFRYCSITNECVLGMTPELFNEGEITTWLTRFYTVLGPYLVKHGVFQKVYGE